MIAARAARFLIPPLRFFYLLPQPANVRFHIPRGLDGKSPPETDCRPDALLFRFAHRSRPRVLPPALVRQVLAVPAPELPRVGRQIQLLSTTPTRLAVDSAGTRKPPANAAMLRVCGLEANIVLHR